jgi:translation initiation factor IF-2
LLPQLQESVVLRYLLCAAGDITTSDVDLAAASGGMIVGFNLNPDENVLSHAKNLGECLNAKTLNLKPFHPEIS